jgi:hypothetical protein
MCDRLSRCRASSVAPSCRPLHARAPRRPPPPHVNTSFPPSSPSTHQEKKHAEACDDRLPQRDERAAPCAPAHTSAIERGEKIPGGGTGNRTSKQGSGRGTGRAESGYRSEESGYRSAVRERALERETVVRGVGDVVLLRELRQPAGASADRQHPTTATYSRRRDAKNTYTRKRFASIQMHPNPGFMLRGFSYKHCFGKC